MAASRWSAPRDGSLARVVLEARCCGAWAGPAHEVGDFHAIRLHAPANLKTFWRDGTMRLMMSPLESILRLAALVSKLQRPARRPTASPHCEQLLRVDEFRAVSVAEGARVRVRLIGKPIFN